MSRFKLDGAIKLIEQLEKMALEGPEMDAALTKAAAPIHEAMVRLAPKGESGDLKAAIKVGNVKKDMRSGRSVDIGIRRSDILLPGPDEYYPAYVEYGHGGPHPAPAHPFVRPAWDAESPTAYQILREELARAMDK